MHNFKRINKLQNNFFPYLKKGTKFGNAKMY